MPETLELNALPKNYLSFTQIAMFLRCPRQYAYRYIEGLKMPPNGNLILGKGAHRGLEWGYSEQIAQGQHPETSKIKESTAEFIHQEINAAKNEGEIEWSENDNAGKIVDDGVTLVEKYDNEVGRHLTAKSVEEKFEVAFTNVEYKMSGRMDLTTTNGRLIDFKTARKSPPENEAEASEQLTAYQIALGDKPKSLEIHGLIRKKTPEIVVRIAPARPQSRINDFLENFGKVATLIKTGLFPKVLENAPGSPCSWCGYYEKCRGKRRPERA